MESGWIGRSHVFNVFPPELAGGLSRRSVAPTDQSRPTWFRPEHSCYGNLSLRVSHSPLLRGSW